MSKRSPRKALPHDPVVTRIESFAHDGRGVAHVDGRAVFIDGALPGETVSFRYRKIRKDFAEGQVAQVLEPSPVRVEPLCPHFGVCGGCSLQHLASESQIKEKQQLLLEQFRRIGKVEPAELSPPLTGPVWGYRHKARLGVKWVAAKNRVLVGFREKASPWVADLQICPVLHPKLGERLPELASMIEGLSIRERLPQIEVAIGDTQPEVGALVFRVLAEPSGADLQALKAFGKRHGFDIYLQTGGPDSLCALYPESPSLLSYANPDLDLTFRFTPTDFTQVNMAINRLMIDRVLKVLDVERGDRVLDLFCGIGNFTLPLARLAAKVVGVEGVASAVERARGNAKENGLTNVEFFSTDLTQPQEHVPWAMSRYDKVLLDPSRNGAQEVLTLTRKWNAARMVYVSCNPSTLARDAGILVHQYGYRLVSAGVMDMFPHTAHVESIALFER